MIGGIEETSDHRSPIRASILPDSGGREVTRVPTATIEHPELKLKVWTMASLGFDTPGYALISSDEYAAKNPKIVGAFAKATFKGTDYALKNAYEAVDILVKAAPELKKEIESAKWKATIGPTQSEATKKDGLGAMDKAKWENLNELLQSYAVIDNKVDLSKVLKAEYRR